MENKKPHSLKDANERCGIKERNWYDFWNHCNPPSLEFVKEYEDKIDWFAFCLNANITEEIVEAFPNNVNWDGLSCGGSYGRWSEDFIYKHRDKWSWWRFMPDMSLGKRDSALSNEIYVKCKDYAFYDEDAWNEFKLFRHLSESEEERLEQEAYYKRVAEEKTAQDKRDMVLDNFIKELTGKYVNGSIDKSCYDELLKAFKEARYIKTY